MVGNDAKLVVIIKNKKYYYCDNAILYYTMLIPTVSKVSELLELLVSRMIAIIKVSRTAHAIMYNMVQMCQLNGHKAINITTV